jgi:hypothetical protein
MTRHRGGAPLCWWSFTPAMPHLEGPGKVPPQSRKATSRGTVASLSLPPFIGHVTLATGFKGTIKNLGETILSPQLSCAWCPLTSFFNA